MKQPRELRTSEVARLFGIPADLLRKWKKRGFLPNAPRGVSGQGRSVECFWSEVAIEEVRARVATTRGKIPRNLMPTHDRS